MQAKKTPLHMAAQMGQMQVCSTLLEMKADPNATDEVDCFLFNSVNFNQEILGSLMKMNGL